MRHEKPSLSGTLADNLARQIEDGLLRAGDKLPSIREYAEANGCSKNTVISAFDALTARGLIEPRRGAGFFVASVAGQQPADEDAPTLDRAMDSVWLMREQLQSKPDFLNVGEGFPPVAWLEETRLDHFHQRVVRTGVASLFRYGSRFGYLPLRQHLQQSWPDTRSRPRRRRSSSRMARIRPWTWSCVTSCARATRFSSMTPVTTRSSASSSSGANIVGVPRGVDGPDIVALEEQLKTHRPKLFFTQSVGHNPTATDISAAKAHRILRLAEAHDLIVVENDALADLKPRSATRICALDQLRRTIYVGS